MKRPLREEVSVFSSAPEFRSWLESNHDRADSVWMGHYRKGVDKPSIAYHEAVDEGLCFGWIDGISYRVDDEVHAVRFTPRRRRSHWSAANVAKVAALQAAGRMTDAGLRAFEARVDHGKGSGSE